jgi:hypothetical protein
MTSSRIVRPGVEPANTVEQLRADIDSGRTGDKIAGPDPAAAPLGADEEAAGTPLRPEAVAAARGSERARPVRPSRHESGLGAAWVLVVIVAVVAAAAAVTSWLMLR